MPETELSPLYSLLTDVRKHIVLHARPSSSTADLVERIDAAILEEAALTGPVVLKLARRPLPAVALRWSFNGERARQHTDGEWVKLSAYVALRQYANAIKNKLDALLKRNEGPAELVVERDILEKSGEDQERGAFTADEQHRHHLDEPHPAAFSTYCPMPPDPAANAELADKDAYMHQLEQWTMFLKAEQAGEQWALDLRQSGKIKEPVRTVVESKVTHVALVDRVGSDGDVRVGFSIPPAKGH